MSSLGFIKERPRIIITKVADPTPTESTHGFSEDLLRPSVLGAIDGLITTFIIIMAGIAGDISNKSILIIGFASLFGDAFSMGTSEFLSSRTETPLKKSMKRGLVCGLSFCLFGCVQLITFLIFPDNALLASSLVFVAALILVWVLQSYILQEYALNKCVEILLLGLIAGAIAYATATVSHFVA